MRSITVHTSPAYSVQIGAGLLRQCGGLLREALPGQKTAVVTDSTVAPLYLSAVRESLQSAGFTVCSHIFSAGETSKNFDTLSGILEFLADERLTRTDSVIALGGGVTGDMAGFAAATYLRGVRYAQLPTTLLAAVDSSVGGKTAIDLKAGKNLAGAFLQPSAVLCDTDCLQSLPADVFADGAAEAIKTGILSDESLFALFERDALNVSPEEIIARCIAYKAGVVERDEREQNERRLLNLGHTVGHAIERRSQYAIPHGHAVAAGIAIIARAAERLGWTDEPIAGRVTRCLTRHHLPVDSDFTASELADAASADKKRSGDTITLVIPRRIGHCELKTVPVAELRAVIEAGL